jgi:hypothetical protein
VFRVGQNQKGQSQVKPQGLRFFGRIHRNRNDVRAGCANLRIVLTVIRQLAEAERSPVTAVEQQHQGAVRGQF